VNFAVQPK
jgi:hypothetical protein